MKRSFQIILIFIFMIINYANISFAEKNKKENFKYKCEVKFGEFIEKVRESDQKNVKKLIEHYLKKAFFKASKPKAKSQKLLLINGVNNYV